MIHSVFLVLKKNATKDLAIISERRVVRNVVTAGNCQLNLCVFHDKNDVILICAFIGLCWCIPWGYGNLQNLKVVLETTKYKR